MHLSTEVILWGNTIIHKNRTADDVGPSENMTVRLDDAKGFNITDDRETCGMDCISAGHLNMPVPVYVF